jgi:hypothetical protein
MDDRAIVGRQLGRRPRAFRRVALRCPFGLPAVTEQHPFDRTGEPFPTTYYVTCRHLVAALSRLEAVGGVERWSRAVETDPRLAASLAQATEEQRQVRHELAREDGHVGTTEALDLGIGGSRSPGHLKCLHAHAAFALARPGYVLGEAILAEVKPLWPPYRCCWNELKPS